MSESESMNLNSVKIHDGNFPDGSPRKALKHFAAYATDTDN